MPLKHFWEYSMITVLYVIAFITFVSALAICFMDARSDFDDDDDDFFD